MATQSGIEQESKLRGAGHRRHSSETNHAAMNRTEMILEAIEELRSESGVNRVGVWLEEPGEGEGGEPSSIIFRGETWEESLGNGMLGWRTLSPLPSRMEMLRAGLCCEHEITGPTNGLLLGPELLLPRVLWAPVMVRRTLRGLILVGSAKRKKALACAKVEKVAARLGLRLELEEVQRLASGRKADQELWRSIKRLLSGGRAANLILDQLTDSCTRGRAFGGVGAVFALIAERRTQDKKMEPGQSVGSWQQEEGQLLIRAQRGDAALCQGVHRGALQILWRRALANGRTAVAEADTLPSAKKTSRIVALPVGLEDETVAVLMTGLPKENATLETLDRLEWRSALAAEVFEQERRAKGREPGEVLQTASLELRNRPTALVSYQQSTVQVAAGAKQSLQNEGGLLLTEHSPSQFAGFSHFDQDRSASENPEIFDCEPIGGPLLPLRLPEQLGIPSPTPRGELEDGLVRQQGGTITADSPSGGEVRFAGAFAAVEEVPRIPEARKEIRPLQTTQLRLTDKKGVPHILVVEDEPAMAKRIAAVLRKEGMEVDVVPDEQKAFELAQYVYYNLAICRMNGAKLDRENFFDALVRSCNPLRNHVLFLTGDDTAPAMRAFLSRNRLPQVAKPFCAAELYLAVRALMRKNALSAQAQEAPSEESKERCKDLRRTAGRGA
jgi:CheY-like chemotaxis protein